MRTEKVMSQWSVTIYQFLRMPRNWVQQAIGLICATEYCMDIYYCVYSFKLFFFVRKLLYL
jgi:hypothetical protein